MKLKMFFLLLSTILILTACKDNTIPIIPNIDSDYFTCIIEGEHYKNFTITIDSVPQFCAYNYKLNYTKCLFNLRQKNTASIEFYGNSYGKYPISETDSNKIKINFIQNKQLLEIKLGQIIISNYGNESEYIEGIFSGTGILIDDSLKEEFVSVTNGRFKVLRNF
jgi:hypothetical protein